MPSPILRLMQGDRASAVRSDCDPVLAAAATRRIRIRPRTRIYYFDVEARRSSANRGCVMRFSRDSLPALLLIRPLDCGTSGTRDGASAVKQDRQIKRSRGKCRGRSHCREGECAGTKDDSGRHSVMALGGFVTQLESAMRYLICRQCKI